MTTPKRPAEKPELSETKAPSPLADRPIGAPPEPRTSTEKPRQAPSANGRPELNWYDELGADPDYETGQYPEYD